MENPLKLLVMKKKIILICLLGSLFSSESYSHGEHIYEQIGQKRSIKDLVVDMIIYSSNLATNIVIELVDAKRVNKTMHKMGAKDINVLRGVEDMKAYDKGLSNSTTAHDLINIQLFVLAYSPGIHQN